VPLPGHLHLHDPQVARDRQPASCNRTRKFREP
jgi:hypothetical protein